MGEVRSDDTRPLVHWPTASYKLSPPGREVIGVGPKMVVPGGTRQRILSQADVVAEVWPKGLAFPLCPE